MLDIETLASNFTESEKYTLTIRAHMSSVDLFKQLITNRQHLEKAWIITTLILTACGGSLTDEQRKKVKEEMAQKQIVKMSDSEILSAALDKGKTVYNALQTLQFDQSKVDSLESLYKADIHWVVPGSAHAKELENQLIEAYILGMATGALQDNIQKVRANPQSQVYDSLVYSKPIVSKMPDGADKLEGVWHIYLSRKTIVLEAGKKK